jgi:hypothetical protein
MSPAPAIALSAGTADGLVKRRVAGKRDRANAIFLIAGAAVE